MRKVKFAMMILAASLLTACGSSKKEQSVNEETLLRVRRKRRTYWLT